MEFELFSSSIHDLKDFHILKPILLRAAQGTKMRAKKKKKKLLRNVNVPINPPKLMPIY